MVVEYLLKARKGDNLPCRSICDSAAAAKVLQEMAHSDEGGDLKLVSPPPSRRFWNSDLLPEYEKYREWLRF